MPQEVVAFIHGFAKGKDLRLTEKAVQWAKRAHEGQERNNGDPYIKHPTRVCQILITHGILDDAVLAAALLHDVIEECGISVAELEKEFNRDVATMVDNLSKTTDMSRDVVFSRIAADVRTVVIKAADRWPNLTDIFETFKVGRALEYIEETEEMIIPMMNRARHDNPQYADILISLRDSMLPVINVVKAALKLKKENERLQAELQDAHGVIQNHID